MEEEQQVARGPKRKRPEKTHSTGHKGSHLDKFGGLVFVFQVVARDFQKALATLGPLLGTDSDTGVITNVVLQHIISGSDLFAADLSCDTSVEMSNGNFNNITCENDEFFISGPGNDPGS